MVAALGLMAVASAVMMLLFMRTMDELRHGQDDAGIVQTLLIAHGGANLGVTLLRGDVRAHLDEIAGDLSHSTDAWSFGSSLKDDFQPTAESVAADLREVARRLQPRIDALVCQDHEVADGQILTLRIHVTDNACGEALPDGVRLGEGRFIEGNRREVGGDQRYALPFVMIAEGTQGDYRRRVVTQGEYQFDVGRASFARYALFTDVHESDISGSGRIWFTSDTLFDGPVHTNGNFNFYNRPWFGGTVTSVGQTQGNNPGAYGYSGGDGSFFKASDLDSFGNAPDLSTKNYTNRPEFASGVDWRASYIALPKNAHDQRNLADENGILFKHEMSWLEIYAADGNGDPISASSSNPAAFQYVRARTRSSSNGSFTTVTYRISPDGRLEKLGSGSSWTIVTESFNGVIYSDQYIPQLRSKGRENDNRPNSARPAVAAFAQLTIVPQNGARITTDLVYEDQPCTGSLRRGSDNEVIRATCENMDALNVLGIFSPSGNIEIGHNNIGEPALNAPEDVRIQASLLTSSGVVRVEDYNQGSSRGAVQLLGGIIEKKYGAFGTFSAGSSMSTGYAREFTFDPRLARGLTPPFFPTVSEDGVKEVFTFTFGHREQVY